MLIESTPRPSSSRSQAAFIKLAIICGALALLYADVLARLVHDWLNDPAQSQGLLIPPLAAYMAWMNRSRTLAEPVREDRRGLLLVALGCVLFLAGKAGAEFFLARISLVFQIAGLLWAFQGIARLRTLAFPLLLLATMVPLPALIYGSLAGPLQLFASRAGALIARAVGVVVYQDGNIINLAGMSLGVEEACSGLHSLTALVVAGMLLGAVQTSRTWIRVALVTLALPVSVGMNVVRIAGTAILADIDQKFAAGFYHSCSGWLVFVLGFLCLFGLGTLLTNVSSRITGDAAA